MEDALTKALEFANPNSNTQKTILKNPHKDNCTLYSKGGKFKIRDFVFCFRFTSQYRVHCNYWR